MANAEPRSGANNCSRGREAAVRPRSAVPQERTSPPQAGDRNFLPIGTMALCASLMQTLTGLGSNSIAATRLHVFVGLRTEASRPRLQFLAPLRGSSLRFQMSTKTKFMNKIGSSNE